MKNPCIKSVRWFVYVPRSDYSGEPMTPLRVICGSEEDANKEYEKWKGHEGACIAKEEVIPAFR